VSAGPDERVAGRPRSAPEFLRTDAVAHRGVTQACPKQLQGYGLLSAVQVNISSVTLDLAHALRDLRREMRSRPL